MDFQSYSQAADTQSLIWNANLQSQDPYIIRGSIYPDTIPAIDAAYRDPITPTISTGTNTVSGVILPAQTLRVFGVPQGTKSNYTNIVDLNIETYAYLMGIPIGSLMPISLSFAGQIQLPQSSNASTTYAVYAIVDGDPYQVLPTTTVIGSKTVSLNAVSVQPKSTAKQVSIQLRIDFYQSANVSNPYEDLQVLDDIVCTATCPLPGSVSPIDLLGHMYTLLTAATQAATEAATQAATEAATQAATEAATQAATEAATQAATEPATTEEVSNM